MVDADVTHADVGDLGLFVTERASPWNLPDCFHINDGDTVLRLFSRTPIHL